MSAIALEFWLSRAQTMRMPAVALSPYPIPSRHPWRRRQQHSTTPERIQMILTPRARQQQGVRRRRHLQQEQQLRRRTCRLVRRQCVSPSLALPWRSPPTFYSDRRERILFSLAKAASAMHVLYCIYSQSPKSPDETDTYQTDGGEAAWSADKDDDTLADAEVASGGCPSREVNMRRGGEGGKRS